jgi:hypothetical protein
MAHEKSKGKTGIYYVKDPAGVVVVQHGVVMHRYKNVQELVEAHVKGVAALEREMEEELARHYRPE